MQTKVSMVVPCYNKIDYVAAMFDSILSQVWDNIELILVNDGSTDGTREVISEYEPQFWARGYDVIIVDQENQGVAAAVKQGLMRVTGEYVCMPDCDDVLDPEYVSAMAGVLGERKGFDCVVSDYSNMPFDYESSICLKKNAPAYMTSNEYPYRLTESLLLAHFSTSVCMGLFKSDIIVKSAIIDNFVLEPRVSQEFQLWLPLAIANARVLHYHRPLYQYNLDRTNQSERDRFSSYASTVDYCEKNSLIQRSIAERYASDGAYYNKLYGISVIATLYNHSHRLHNENNSEDKYLNIMLRYVNEAGLLDKPISAVLSERAGIVVLFRYLSNYFVGYPSATVKISRKCGGRIIAYAAFGIASFGIRRGLLGSDIRPNVFWDIAAKPGDRIKDIPVDKPNFEGLDENDTVLVLLKDVVIAKGVKNMFDQTAARDNIWYYYDVLDYLVDYFFIDR